MLTDQELIEQVADLLEQDGDLLDLATEAVRLVRENTAGIDFQVGDRVWFADETPAPGTPAHVLGRVTGVQGATVDVEWYHGAPDMGRAASDFRLIRRGAAR